MKTNENLGIALVATSNVTLSLDEMSQVNGGIGCCICSPGVSASGAVKYLDKDGRDFIINDMRIDEMLKVN